MIPLPEEGSGLSSYVTRCDVSRSAFIALKAIDLSHNAEIDCEVVDIINTDRSPIQCRCLPTMQNYQGAEELRCGCADITNMSSRA